MSSMSFSEVYSRFFTKIEGYDLFDPNMTDDVRNEFLCSYLHSALSDRYVTQLFSSLSVTDPTVVEEEPVDGTITYELKNTDTDFTDSEFLKEMLAYSMAIAWVTPKVNSLVNIQQLITDAQTKFYAQSNHLSTLIALKQELEANRDHLIAMRGFVSNDYLNGTSAASKIRKPK